MKLKANAKVNLTLDVCGKRQDGYHILDSVFQSVSIADDVEIKIDSQISVTYSDIGCVGSKDICYRAAREFFEYAKILDKGARIYIQKNIPCLAGLGGSSSDAAAVIKGLNLLYNTQFSDDELCNIGLKIGADVPFCIVGGTKRIGGIGEIITPISPIKNCAFLIVIMGEKSSTREMYEQLDSKPTLPPKTEEVVALIEKGDLLGMAGIINNDFEKVHNIAKEKELLSQFSPLGVGLSGSGPAVFAIFEDLKSAETARDSLLKQGITAFAVTPQEQGIIIE